MRAEALLRTKCRYLPSIEQFVAQIHGSSCVDRMFGSAVVKKMASRPKLQLLWPRVIFSVLFKFRSSDISRCVDWSIALCAPTVLGNL
jgi:hypothetical protein